MTNTDIQNVILNINNGQAKQKLEETRQEMEKIRRAKEEAFKLGDITSYRQLTSELTRAQRRYERLQASTENVERTLRNLDRATPRQLRDTIAAINRELNSGRVERGSELWNSYTHALQEANAELQKIREEQKALTSTSKSISDWGTRWQGVVTVFQGIKDNIQSALSQFLGLYEQFAAMDEHLSDVRKYTGLTRQEVDDLNLSFQQMDTRTAREQLNDLAADAGRLGIQSKQDILDFVTAADQINVALGADLGEDAVKNIGKLAQLFGDADTLGLKRGMLSTASIINELAQSSSASEPYLLEFTSRLAGVAHQAGLSSAQVMAFGSILDQGMVGVERSATALQNVITALYAKPQAMAQAAGLQVEEFTRLLRTDANAAILQFIKALSDLGGMDRLAPILKELQLSGSGVTQTLSTLANNLTLLRQTQSQAARAFQEGTSVTTEFNQANNTAQAQFDKTRKQARDLAITLGQQLAPAAQGLLSLGSTLLRLLTTIIPFITRHAGKIAILTAETLALVAAIKSATIATKAHAAATLISSAAHTTARAVTLALAATYNILRRNTERAAAAQRLFNTVLKANPYAIVATALLTLGTAVLFLWRNTHQLTREERARQAILKDTETINQRAQQSMAQEVSRVNLLTAIIRDNTRSVSERRRAIKDLQKIIPSYNANLSEEGRLTRENTQAVRDYITELNKKYIAQAANDRLTELGGEELYHRGQQQKYKNMYSIRLKRLRDFENENAKVVKEYNLLNQRALQGDVDAARLITFTPKYREYDNLRAALKEANHLLAGTNDYLTSIHRRQQNIITTAKNAGADLAKQLQTADPTTFTPTEDGTDGGISTDTSGSTNNPDPNAAALQRIKDQNQQTRLALQVQADQHVITHQEADNRILQADIQMYQQIRDLYKADTTEYLSAEHSRLQASKKLQAQQAAQTIEALRAQEQVEQNQLTQKYLKQDITQKQYEQSQLQIRLKYLQLYIQKSTDADDQDARARYQKEYDELYQSEAIDRVRDFWRRVDQARTEWLAKTPAEQRQDQLDFAAILHKQGILSPEEYKKAIEYINQKYKDGNGNNPKDSKYTTLPSSSDPLSSSFLTVAQSIQRLKDDVKENGKATWQTYANIGVASISTVTAALTQASQLMQASMQAEVTAVTSRYDHEIKAAGTTTRRAQQLEEQKQKAIARIKSRYARRQVKMQIAQAILTTAQNALGAYNSMIKVPFAGPALAAAAAAAATAAGLIQVAIIKKQAAAQEDGYYQGGFTPGRQYRRPAGIVHQGEFVANHEAVLNPALQPILQLIDHAQRTGRVSSLTPLDITQTITQPLLTTQPRLAAATLLTATAAQPLLTQSTAPSSPSSPSDPTALLTDPTDPTLNLPHLLRDLNDNLTRGIQAHVVLSELDRQYRRYNRLTTV